MLLKIALTATAFVVVFLIVAALQSADSRIVRRAIIPAPAAIIFAQLNHLRLWQEWSPWARMDRQAKNTFSGPEAGSGAAFAWDGNAKVGAGSMTILESRPDELVLLRLDFQRPFKATNTSEFVLRPEAGGTEVTWTMTGRRNLVMKAAGLLMNCDKMVGGQFEEGLENLEAVSLAAAR